MKMTRKQAFRIIPAVMLMIMAGGIFTPTLGTITSVVLTPANPTIRHGNNWYLAGIEYDFRVQVIDPSASGDYTHYTNVTLDIPLSATVTVTATWDTDTDAFSISGNAASSDITNSTRAGDQNLDLHFKIIFAWDIAAGANSTPAARTITATAVCDTPTTVIDTANVTYGFCNQITVLNLAQDGDAADGMINPHYTAGNFNITGTLVYDITGADATDAVAAAVIGNITLHEDTDNDGTVDTGILYTDAGGTEDISITANYTYFNAPHVLGNTWWRCQAVLTNPDATNFTATGQNSLVINVNRVQVTSMTVDLGGGRDDASTHWKSYLVPGTRFTINAVIQNGSGNMAGNTTFTINYNTAPDATTEFTITIPNGQSSASTIIPLANTPNPGAGSTSEHDYYVVKITGSSYGDQGDGIFPAHQDDQIDDQTSGSYGGPAYTSQKLYWENTDPPDITTDSITDKTSAATTATLWWTPLDPTANLADEGDFYEFRIYYRLAGSSDPFTQFDGDDDPLLRGIANNPSPLANPALNIDATGKYTTITNLSIFSSYEYYIVAVDLFGNESPVVDESGTPIGTYSQFVTTPYSIEATVTDGITNYENADFAAGPDTYSARPLRESNIKIKLTIVVSTEESEPDLVRVWYTNNASDGTDVDIVSGNEADTASFSGADILESSIAERTGPNTWTAQLPTTSEIITNGNQVRFVVETVLDADKSFSDYNSGADSEANTNEWSFAISTSTTFTPWPTRVLNNVITDKNRVAYPSYYLTSDARVTIKIYDIKGRPVVTLLDNAFRKGGQNIKDQGWRGTNKAGRKLGVGLYHMHFHAKRASDGKVILNKFKKVVIAR